MTLRKIDVSLGERSYPILIGDGLLRGAQALLDLARGRQVAIVTDETVAALHLAALAGALAPASAALVTVVLPGGEANKDWPTLNRIFDALLENRFDRHCMLVALGGGVVGDVQ